MRTASRHHFQQRQIDEQRQVEVHRDRMRLRNDIHLDVRWSREAATRLDELYRGATPITENEEEACWDVMSLCLTDLRMAEEQYMQLSGLGGSEYGDGY